MLQYIRSMRIFIFTFACIGVLSALTIHSMDGNPDEPAAKRRKLASAIKSCACFHMPIEELPYGVPPADGSSPFMDAALGCPDIIANILSFLKAQESRNLLATCKPLYQLIKSSGTLNEGSQQPPNERARQIVVNLVRAQLEQDHFDPITHVLLAANGNSDINLYHSTVNTANLVNLLLCRHAVISKMDYDFIKSRAPQFLPPRTSDHKISNFEATGLSDLDMRCEELKLPAGLTISSSDRIACSQWIIAKQRPNEPFDHFIHEVVTIAHEKPTAYLKLIIENGEIQPIIASELTKLNPKQIVSINCRYCAFPDGTACLSQFNELRELSLFDCEGSGELFCKELCALPELKKLIIKAYHHPGNQDLSIPAAIQNMKNLRCLNLQGYNVHFPGEIINLRDSLKILLLTCPCMVQLNPIVLGASYVSPDALQAMTDLQSLIFSAIAPGQSLDNFCQMLNDLKQLRKITFDSSIPANRRCNYIKVITKLGNLQHLCLHVDHISWSQLKQLAELTCLRSIIINNTYWVPSKIRAFVQKRNILENYKILIDRILNLPFDFNKDSIQSYLAKYPELRDALSIFKRPDLQGDIGFLYYRIQQVIPWNDLEYYCKDSKISPEELMRAINIISIYDQQLDELAVMINPFFKTQDGTYLLEKVLSKYPMDQRWNALKTLAGSNGMIDPIIELNEKIRAQQSLIERVFNALNQVNQHCKTCVVHHLEFNGTNDGIQAAEAFLNNELVKSLINSNSISVAQLESLAQHYDELNAWVACLPQIEAYIMKAFSKIQYHYNDEIFDAMVVDFAFSDESSYINKEYLLMQNYSELFQHPGIIKIAQACARQMKQLINPNQKSSAMAEIIYACLTNYGICHPGVERNVKRIEILYRLQYALRTNDVTTIISILYDKVLYDNAFDINQFIDPLTLDTLLHVVVRTSRDGNIQMNDVVFAIMATTKPDMTRINALGETPLSIADGSTNQELKELLKKSSL